MQVREHAQALYRRAAARISTGLSRRELWLTVVALAVLQTFIVVVIGPNDGVLAPLMGFAATAALLWHRSRLPAVVVAVGLLSVGALALFSQPVLGVIVAALITVNLVSARSAPRVSWATTAVFALIMAATAYRSLQGSDKALGLVLAALAAGLVLSSWVVGQLRRARAQEVDAISERMRQAEVGRAQAEQIAVLTERTRIAREMHDIIAHSISGLVALADGGRYAAPQDPDAAVRALREISRGGREALGELRGVISTLRDPSGQLGGPPPESTMSLTSSRPRPRAASTWSSAPKGGPVQSPQEPGSRHTGLCRRPSPTWSSIPGSPPRPR